MSNSVTKESNVDVLIIGAGPAGLMCANALSRAGINVRIIDQRSTPLNVGQADGIQPRTTEVFQSYGLGARLMEQGVQTHRIAFYEPNPDGGIKCRGRVSDTTHSTARYPFTLIRHQPAVEAILMDSMRTYGVEVERSTVPTAIEMSTNSAQLHDPTSHPVRVVLQHLEHSDIQSNVEVVHAKFVLGADGAHSWVRTQFNIPVKREQTDYVWGVVDIHPDTDFPDIRNLSVIQSYNGSCETVPREGDRVRVYMQLTDKDMVKIDPTTGRIDKNGIGPTQLLEVAQKYMHPYKISTSHDAYWWSIFSVGHHLASRYSAHDRVFIAGDACHAHSPAAGQGMNASMNDTHNLAWKLAYVLRGWSNISLLKTYEFERRAYAEELVAFDSMFIQQLSDKYPAGEEPENRMKREEFARTFQSSAAFISGTSVHYGPSPIVNTAHQSCASKLIIGQRMPPHEFIRAADVMPIELQDLLPSDTRFKIIVFAGNTADKLQFGRVQALAAELEKADGFLKRFSRGALDTVFDILCISSAGKTETTHLDVPELLRPHWSKVLLDDGDIEQRSHAGGGYEYYGIDPARGAIVVVRPDGYVGAVAPFEHLDDINEYFAAFMLESMP